MLIANHLLPYRHLQALRVLWYVCSNEAQLSPAMMVCVKVNMEANVDSKARPHRSQSP